LVYGLDLSPFPNAYTYSGTHPGSCSVDTAVPSGGKTAEVWCHLTSI